MRANRASRPLLVALILLLDIFERVARENGPRDRRFRI